MNTLRKSQNINMVIRFIIYGFIGWGMEIIWTGLASAFSGDMRFKGYTYLWMFPIYGFAVFLESVHDLMMGWPLIVRGGIWVIIIFSIEYLSGWLLTSYIGKCPWDYSGAKYAVKGWIRLDYAPAWFVAGLLFERIHILLDRIL